jgi:translation initiation factor IF-2
VVYSGLGPVTASDANLALATGAALLAFSLRPPEPAVAALLERGGAPLLRHDVIYRLLDDVAARLAGLTPAAEVEVVVGRAEVG